MLLEALSHLAALDFGWFVSLALGNLLMAFMLLAVFYFFLEGKNFLKGSIVIFITLFAFMDFEKVLGIAFFTGGFLLVYYLSKFAVLALAENSKALRGKMIFISEMQFYAALLASVILLGH